jgi:hypothetical protein
LLIGLLTSLGKVSAQTLASLPFSGSTSTTSAALSISNTGSGQAILGNSPSGYGVYGGSTSSIGVVGSSQTGIGVAGLVPAGSKGNAAVFGRTITSGNATTTTANTNYAGLFDGLVAVSGNLITSGTLQKGAGSFKIDDPLDPANKYLSHSFVESPDMMNIYNGIVAFDANSEAWVEMPKWFEALNRDFRYQLTCIGSSALVYIAQEMVGNRFKIAGGKPGMKVSWQVTGVRHDPYANAHRIQVEENKPVAERGYYLHPELYGQLPHKSVMWARNSELMQQAQQQQQQLAQQPAMQGQSKS